MHEWLRTLLGAAAAALALRLFVMELVRVKGGSMQDTLRNGQIMLVWKLGWQPRRGDVVICKYPGRYLDKHKLIPQYFVKRVIGLPGETLSMEEGKVLIDGRMLMEPYLSEGRNRRRRGLEARKLTGYFVMGDNRDSSNDSRGVGPIERRMLVGKAVAVLWPPRIIR